MNKRIVEVQVDRLNNDKARDVLATEWEVAVLNALGHLGHVESEISLGGKTRPDVVFRLNADGVVSFVADVTSVSDQGSHEENPVQWIEQELIRQIEKSGLSPTRFDLQIASSGSSYKGGNKIKLPIPNRSKVQNVLTGASFKSFIGEIKSQPENRHEVKYTEDGYNFEIRFDPNQRGMTVGHPVYTMPSDPEKNPVWSAMKKKADQLRASGFDGIKGIILCDGGCDLLGKSMPGWQFYSCDELIHRFLRKHKSLSFVLVLGVKEISWTSYQIQSTIYVGPEISVQSESNLEAPWITALRSITIKLPIPLSTSSNALNRLKSDLAKVGHHFGYMKTSYGTKMKITFSARALKDILAGDVSVSEYATSFGDGESPFITASKRGLIIEDVYIESLGENCDDDKVTIVYSPSRSETEPFTASLPNT